jgi:DNA repair protein RadC
MIVSKEKVRLANSKDASDHIMKLLGKMDQIDTDKEHFWVIHLNARNLVLSVELVAIGCLTGALVHPREVYRRSVHNGAAAIIAVHNHPSGDPTPSPEDVQLTERLTEAGRIIGIRLLDHIIIAEGKYASLIGRH